MRNPQIGRVTLVGAGPGDPELLTIKALKAIRQADVIVHDRLVSAEVLALVPRHIRRIDVGKRRGHHAVPQSEINELLVSLAFQCLNVTRLKGGDPLIFGRGGEELEALRKVGIRCSCIPGITAAQGAASSALVPLTHRGLATGLRYVTGHRASNEDLRLDWRGLASAETTLIVYMGASTIGDIAGHLIEQGLPESTPVLAVIAATTRREKRLQATIGSVTSVFPGAIPEEPVLFIIGHVAALDQTAAASGVLDRLRERHEFSLA